MTRIKAKLKEITSKLNIYINCIEIARFVTVLTQSVVNIRYNEINRRPKPLFRRVRRSTGAI